MKRYIWKGELTLESVDVKDGDAVTSLDLTLVNNGEIDAPEDHWLIKQWVAAGLLVEVPAEAGRRSRAYPATTETTNAQE